MNYGSNKLVELKRKIIVQLSEIYPKREAINLVDILITHFLGLSRIEQTLQADLHLTESELLHLHSTANELLKHKPVQYITGKTDFLGLTLQVSEAVLIPRFETEELIVLIEQNEKTCEPLRILDVGTGSGCIALALKQIFPKAVLTGIDISKTALKIAKINASTNHQDVYFLQFDILKSNGWTMFGLFDIIVSNPPYVTESEKASMGKNVLEYEPHLALFVSDNNPLLFYREIARFGLQHLKKGGHLYFEINEKRGEDIRNLLHEIGYRNILIHKDFYEKNRFISAMK